MNELEREIRRRIEAAGPLAFAEFMDLALYHPEHGYYSRRPPPIGRGGDYYTNAQLQPVFGRMIAQRIERWRRELGSPRDFTVVELGAGRGETAQEVRAHLPNVKYIELEKRSGAMPERFVGVVVCNEFFDALPVDVVRFDRGRPRERRVGLDQAKLAWVDAGPPRPQVEGYLRLFAAGAAADQTIEVNLQGLEWMGRIAGSLERGFVLTIDYGYEAVEIAGGRRFPNGSLMSYRSHTASEDVLADPGERDITADVNFTALAGHGERLGLEAEPLQTQAQFLLSIGEPDQFQFALAAASEDEAQRHRLQLKTLLVGMGETFRVLVQSKRGLRPAA